MKAQEEFVAIAALGLVAFIAVVWLAKKAGQGLVTGAAAVGNAVNPVSDKNLAYKAANALTQVFTGTSDTLGSWFYDMTHQSKVKEIQAMTGPIVPAITQPAITQPAYQLPDPVLTTTGVLTDSKYRDQIR